jgi:hypothetical protein
MGVSFGSSAGTPSAIGDFGRMMEERTTKGINATTYIKMMAHTAPVNIGVFFGMTGRVITTSRPAPPAARASATPMKRFAAASRRAMMAGGAEELCATEAAVFDTLFATSVRNDAPHTTPRPFDGGRDGPGDRRRRRLPDSGRDANMRRRAARRSTPSWWASAPTATAATSRSRMRNDENGDATGAGGRGPAAIGDRLRQRARHRHRAGRHRRIASDTQGIRQERADQFPEKLHGPHAGRLRRAGSLDQHRNDARRLVCANHQSGNSRSAMRGWITSPAKAGRLNAIT